MFERRDFLKGIAGLSTLEKGKLYCLQIDFNSNLEVIATGEILWKEEIQIQGGHNV